jgi:hypothetical protein
VREAGRKGNVQDLQHDDVNAEAEDAGEECSEEKFGPVDGLLQWVLLLR